MLITRALRATASLAFAALAIAASPAAANEPAAATQMSGAVKGEVVATSGNGDKEFSQLFASWKQTEAPAGALAVPRQTGSVP